MSSIDDILNRIDSGDYAMPQFQRGYVWNRAQVRKLMTSLYKGYPVGAILLWQTPVEDADIKGEKVIGQGTVNLILDGQQRMTTLTIVIAALVKYLRTHGATADGLTADDISGTFLHVKTGDGAAAKLILSLNDCPTLEAVVNATPMPERPSERITENLDYFYGEMEKSDFDADVLWAGMKVLTVIDAELDRGDNPQLIFESLNARGVPLTTADLVRNYLLIAMDHDEQTRLYREYWEPIEVMFGDDPGAEKLNAAIRTWLSIRFPKVRIHDKSETYSVFKTYIEDEHAGTPEELLDELRGFCFMWAENYNFHEVKEFRCMNWAKGNRRTLVPERASQGGF